MSVITGLVADMVFVIASLILRVYYHVLQPATKDAKHARNVALLCACSVFRYVVGSVVGV
jgi:hypothetical protein